MPSQIDAGYASQAGVRERNEDFVGMVTPNEPELSNKGMIVAIADGVSGNDGGREAAEYTVRGLLSDYYATPDTWPISQALDRVLKATNSWVQQQGTIRRELAGMASTLTTMVLRGHYYYFAHVGDSRLYLLRDQTMQRLTTDHVWDRPEMQHVLTRAIGLDRHLTLDQGMGEIRVGDVFLLLTDGIWATIKENVIQAILTNHLTQGSTGCAEQLVSAALAAGSLDNASALVVHITALSEKDWRDTLSDSQSLPVPNRLKPGQTIDGYVVESVLHSSQATVVYKVIDQHNPFSTPLVLKTLNPDRTQNAQERTAFAHEEWLARRAVARFFPQVITPPQRNYLYYLSTWHAGHTFQQRHDSDYHFTVSELLAHGEKLVRAIAALHRRSIIHRDIKPANIHLGDDGQLRILDLGVAQSGRETELPGTNVAPQAGTPSFLAPEQFDHAPPSVQTDLYAIGVTLYFLLTRHYPYGEIEPFQRPRFGEPVPPTRYRPDLPLWFELVLLKAVARDPEDRFTTAEEFLVALERGGAAPLPPPPVKRDTTKVMALVATISIGLNLLLLYLLVVR